MPRLEVLEHAEIYRNPHPNTTSEYVAFPSILALPSGTLLCQCRHGSARESDDGIIKIHRSTDGGLTWTPGGELPREDAPGFYLPGGFGLTPDNGTIAWLRYPSGPVTIRSNDEGLSWSEPETISEDAYPGQGPGGNLVLCTDGTLIAAAEWGEKNHTGPHPDWAALTARSKDGGRTWDTWQKAHGPQDGVYYFDLRIAGLADDRLLAAYWTHDMAKDQGLNVHTATSSDQGQTWTQPRDADFWGQVTSVAGLQSGRVIAVTNHRRPPYGVRALLSDDGGETFDEQNHLELWGIEPATVRNAPVLAKRRDRVENALEAYHFFTFGTPTATQVPDGTIVVAFYVTEEHVTYVRCCRLREV